MYWQVVHGLLCPAGEYWKEVYFEWAKHAAVHAIMLSENYFGSQACREEFAEFIKQVPYVMGNEDRIVIPLVVSSHGS